MPVSATFRTFILDQLCRVAPEIDARSMFGGVGVYSGEVFFALMADDALYLKEDPLDDIEALRPWVDRAIDVARRARGTRRSRGRT